MSRDDARRAEDILETIDAITYRVFTIGEATKAMSTTATGAHPDVPWSNIARMRDLIGHHYCRRDPQVILATIRDPLTQLREACTQIAATTSERPDTPT